jgi:micrococcal nuclease
MWPSRGLQLAFGLALALMLVSWLATDPTELPHMREKGDRTDARVIRVIFGDTIEVDLARHRREKVRYIGINTPETTHPRKGFEPFGSEARDANRRLVEGQTVQLEFDVQERDRFGRLLAYVYVGDVMVNAELVRQGYAQAATSPPNVKFQELFRQLQREARQAGRGLWGRKG